MAQGNESENDRGSETQGTTPVKQAVVALKTEETCVGSEKTTGKSVETRRRTLIYKLWRRYNPVADESRRCRVDDETPQLFHQGQSRPGNHAASASMHLHEPRSAKHDRKVSENNKTSAINAQTYARQPPSSY